MSNKNESGMREELFAEPYAVTAFPNSSFYQPTAGLAIGVEYNDVFGGERLIVRYKQSPVRKSTGEETNWPGGLIYLSERDVSGWKKGGL